MQHDNLFRGAAALILVGGALTLLFLGRGFLVPLVVAGLLAMMTVPLDNWLMNRGVPKGVSIGLVTLLLITVLAGVLVLLGYQSRKVFTDLDQIEQRASDRVDKLQVVAEERLGFELNQDFNVERYSERILRSSANLLLTLVGSVGTLLLTLVYFILFLVEKARFRRFFTAIAPPARRAEMDRTVDEVTRVSRRYLYGKAIITLILGVLYGLGFWLAGIRFAFMLALIGALLAILPYIGNLIAAAVAALVILATGGGGEQLLWLAGVMAVAQLLESYVLTPVIVGEEVSLNGLATVVAVVGFGSLWGAPGAILGIPIVGMCKVAFEHVDALRPYAYLLGTEQSTPRR